jgi:hypothetical protein
MWIISTIEIFNLTKEDLVANIAIFVKNEIGFLNHTFRTGEIHDAEENNETLHFKINLAKNDTNEPINDIDADKAKDEGLGFAYYGKSFSHTCSYFISRYFRPH